VADVLVHVEPGSVGRLEATNQARLEWDTMEALLEGLYTRLHEWKPETAALVRQILAELIDLADHDALDIVRSRVIEQQVLDVIDGPASVRTTNAD